MRTCVFCQGKATSKEDVWPRWLMKRFPKRPEARMFFERRGRPPLSWAGQDPKLEARQVCQGCNNGWMSKLENEAKPVIESMLEGQLKRLHASGQSALARWGVKTATVLQTYDPECPSCYSEEDRYLFAFTGAIPHHTSVCIAKCVEKTHIYSSSRHHWTGPGKEGAQAFVTTMAFGSLAMQVVAIKPPEGTPADARITYDTREGPWDRALVWLWPSSMSSKDWPPEYGLSGDHGLLELDRRLVVPQDE